MPELVHDVPNELKAAMRRMPSAVALITAFESDHGAAAGMVASAVIPVSMDPPSMLISVNKGARTHSIIEQAGEFCINLLTTDQKSMVDLFSDQTMRDSRFAGSEWRLDDVAPYLPDACANIFCSVQSRLAFGTHEIFVGEVFGVHRNGQQNDPLGWIEGACAKLSPLI